MPRSPVDEPDTEAKSFPRRRNLTPWFLFAPAIAWVIGVTLLPILYAIRTSFYDQQYAVRGDFVGLENYKQALTGPGAVEGFILTLVFTVLSVLLAVAIAVGLALMLNRAMKGITVLRALFILPWIMSPVLAGLLWKWSITPAVGPVSDLIARLVGREQVDLLSSGSSALAMVVIVSVWKTYPFGMVLILASLRTIPAELTDAARVDGANAINQFRYVTLPMMRNTILVITIFFTVKLLTEAEIPLVLTGGGPAGSTELVGLRIYREAFLTLNVDVASALAIVVFLANAVLALIYVKVIRSEDN